MTQCFTCDANLQETMTKAILYQCGMCKEKTPYCFKCSHIIIKLLSPQVFKCHTCNTITKIMSKEEVIFTNSNQISNTSYSYNGFNHNSSSVSPQQCFFSLETPNKSSMISHYQQQKQQQYNYLTPRNSSFKEDNFIADFNKITLINPNDDNNLQQSFIKMSGKIRNVTPVRNQTSTMTDMKLNLSNGSEQKSEFAGYNKKGKKNPVSLRKIPLQQQEMISCNSNNNIIEMKKNCNIIPLPIQNINFKRGYDESNKPRFGVKCTLGDAQLNNTFYIPDLGSSSFKLN